MWTVREDCKEFNMYRKEKYIRKKRHLGAFVLVPSVFGYEFPTAEFWMISAETSLLGSRNKIAKCLMRTFTYRSTFLYAERFSIISILFRRSKQKIYLGLSPQRGSQKLWKTICTYTKVFIWLLGPSKKCIWWHYPFCTE